MRKKFDFKILIENILLRTGEKKLQFCKIGFLMIRNRSGQTSGSTGIPKVFEIEKKNAQFGKMT